MTSGGPAERRLLSSKLLSGGLPFCCARSLLSCRCCTRCGGGLSWLRNMHSGEQKSQSEGRARSPRWAVGPRRAATALGGGRIWSGPRTAC
jgi:hypothetical protein